MFLFNKKKAPAIAQLAEGIKETVATRDQNKIENLLQDLWTWLPTEREKVEGYIGFTLLCLLDDQLEGIQHQVDRFIKEFPESLSPVRVEYGVMLSDRNDFDGASYWCRDYLVVLKHRGILNQLEQFSIARKGASRAFFTVTAASTMLGARSYSKRILQEARRYRVMPDMLEQYQSEIEHLDQELADEKNRRMDEVWEAFFNSGQKGADLTRYCIKQGYPRMADRIDLWTRYFQSNPGFVTGTEEIYQQVRRLNLVSKGEDKGEVIGCQPGFGDKYLKAFVKPMK